MRGMSRPRHRRIARLIFATMLLTAGCKRKETPSFKIVDDPTLDVPTIIETAPERTAPDLSVGMLAREAAAALDARVSGLRRREEAIELDGAKVVVTAFIDSSGVRVVWEHPADRSAPGPNARYYFQNDELLYYESTARLRDARESTARLRDARESTARLRDARESTARLRDARESTARLRDGNPPGRRLLRTVIGFDGHRGALERTRTLDGTPARMDGAVVDSVLARADHILEALARGSPPK